MGIAVTMHGVALTTPDDALAITNITNESEPRRSNSAYVCARAIETLQVVEILWGQAASHDMASARPSRACRHECLPTQRRGRACRRRMLCKSLFGQFAEQPEQAAQP